MGCIADNKTFRSTPLRLGVAVCLLLAGCGGKPVEPNSRQNTLVRADRYDRAVLELSRVLEKNPHNARAYYERGLIYYEMGQYDWAWQDIRKAQSLGYDVPAEFLKLLSEARGAPEK